ncbi:MAG: acetyl-CoA carboxylase biotin carboxylase subunit [Planctomycetota bacterium]|jgi:acetyl-CoA carboxylase biotin carboxylase subunit|nr:acetyl-CoA carboxylase biotin carboxylase subunit [Planctomycetota bacterium]MSR37333.1 acetyl-CoA carboxylase biotin carboxylase subunit [Planctomycetota bacterium]
MFSRILIANRGEIALRILRACKDMGIETVAVYSEADRDLLHLRYADETICIGPAASSDSYLNIPALIAAAEITDVEAIHPGYGFLSENEHFAEVCQSCNIKFIGPSPKAIAQCGDKVAAKQLAKLSGVPTVPGSDGPIEDEQQAVQIARQIGFPVLVKAAAGGGGRGMRVAHNEPSLVTGFHAARAEAEKAFKNGTVYLEKYIEKPRHVEIQIVGDQHGNVVHFGERDCSLQRRHQKLLEESPCPVLDPETRAKMGEAAIRLAKAANYYSAGTVEFLLDKDKNFYFIEINSRIQVEHPVTEMVTGVDLIREMIHIANGERLSVRQEDVQLRGHAMEFRINAEDPERGFKPSPGKIHTFVAPAGPGVRWDSHVYQGYTVPPHYDSMVGKLIIHRPNRKLVIETARRALQELTLQGITTTVGLFLRILDHSDFAAGDIDTGFIDRYFTPR